MALCRGCLSFGNAFAILRFCSAGPTNGFPSSRCASAIQIDASRTTASVCSRRNEEGYASKKFAISDHKFKSPLTMFPRYGFQITSRSRKPKVAASATASCPSVGSSTGPLARNGRRPRRPRGHLYAKIGRCSGFNIRDHQSACRVRSRRFDSASLAQRIYFS